MSRVTECTGPSLAAATTWSTQGTVRSEINIIHSQIIIRISGRINTPLLRLLDAAYESGSLPRGGLESSSLPSARTIRKVPGSRVDIELPYIIMIGIFFEIHIICSAKVLQPMVKNYDSQVSVMMMYFGQFLGQDLTLTPDQG